MRAGTAALPRETKHRRPGLTEILGAEDKAALSC